MKIMLALLTLASTAGVATVAFAAPADRDVVVVAPQPESWGASSDTAIVVGAMQIVPPNDTVTWGTSSAAARGIGVFQTSAATPSWFYQLHVPSGALLQRVEMEACDTSATASLNFGLTSGLVPGGLAADISSVASTGGAATPGCAFFPVTPTAITRIDNAARNYWIFVFWSGTGIGAATELHSFRVYYRLQVSPAPATATFPNDVPTTHPFFRFVEAMAASGLTGGCGSGSYCPDSPVTRGQMAVFLSTALGLHFPN